MAGTIPVAGNLSFEDLAATLTSHEQLAFEQVTALTTDPTRTRNLVTTVAQLHQLGPLELLPAGQTCAGTRILSTTVYIQNTQTAIDLFRLPLHAAETAEDLEAGSDARRDVPRTLPGHPTPPPPADPVKSPRRQDHPEDPRREHSEDSKRGNDRDRNRDDDHLPEDIEADPSPS